ncbi:MAG TPA: hypothetical protein VI585_01825 [Candidatus Binatia bacterium]
MPVRLRSHPLMSYHGLPNWPPVWTWLEGTENKRLNGEVGVLKKVRPSSIEPVNRIFLYIEHEKEAYIGCLLFDNPPFCLQIASLLQDWCERPIREIGALDLSFTL